MLQKFCKKVNDWVGAPMALVAVILVQIIWMAVGTVTHKDPYPFPFLLTISNIAQLILIFVLAVGQNALHDKHDALHEKIDATLQPPSSPQ